MSEDQNIIKAISPDDEDDLLPTEAELADGELPIATIVETGAGGADVKSSPEVKVPVEHEAEADDKLKGNDVKKRKGAGSEDTTQENKPAADKKGEADVSKLEQAMKDQAREDEKPQSSSFSLRKILGGDWLTAELLRRQIGVILLITGFIIVYISNRYSCQKDMLEIDRLNAELIDAKYRALSSTSELTERCRESNVLEMLQANQDSILKIASQPPYIITVPDNYVRINNK